METPFTHSDHIERHHAGEHAPATEPLLQHGDIADTVLQRHDDGVLWRVLRDLVRDVCRVGALDRDQHDAGAVEDCGIFRQREPTRIQLLLGTVEIRQPQAEPLDLGLHPRTHQQRDPTVGSRQLASDKTANGAGAGHHDRSIRSHQTLLPE